MDVTEILTELEYFTPGTFPREALLNAIANRDLMIPELLAALEASIRDVQKLIDDPEYMLHLYAMYLLAQFREPRAYPLIAEFFTLHGDVADETTGDLVPDHLSRILASVSCGDDSLIKAMIENEAAEPFVRGGAVSALTILVACGEKPREEVVSYFHELFNGKIKREYSHVWESLVYCGTDLYPEELYQDIEECYRDGLIDPFFMGIDEVQEMLELGKEETLRRLRNHWAYRIITDAIREMEWWDCFKPPEITERGSKNKKSKALKNLQRWLNDDSIRYEEPVKVQKIGRNEPCPCGSGKKYKKCCLLKEQISTAPEPEPMLPEEVYELDSLTNAVPHLVRTGQLEKAEEICRQLITRYPDQVDGLDRLALVYEAKGDKARAAQYYRKAADFMRRHPGFDEEGIAWMENEAKRLE